MTQEQKTKISEHFDELHATVSDCGFNPPNDISDALRAAYLAGADYALDIYRPRWISVEDELPPRDTFFNISKMKKEHIEKFNLKDKELDTSIGCLVVIRGGMLGLSNYNYQTKAWGIACGEEITHWMPLPSIEGLKEGGEE